MDGVDGHDGPPIGVVVMAYGTPRSPDDLERYYTDIRRGRAPTPEQLADLRRRYDALGGVSPLAERTERQRGAVQAALDQRAGKGRYRVVLGQKHAAPFIEQAAEELVEAGISHVIGLVLAPHYSQFSVGEYQQRLARRTTERATDRFQPMTVVGIEQWHTEDAYRTFLADAVGEALAPMPTRTKVLFTAHSLPERVLVDDPYPDQLRESAGDVAERLDLDQRGGWDLAWQSAGRTPEPWRGPDVLDVVRALAATAEVDGVVACPQGFTSDHLEVLYDLDIEARAVAEEVGLAFARTRSINDDPAVMGALAERIHAAAESTVDASRPDATGATQRRQAEQGPR